MEILTEKFLLLRDAYDKLKDETTLVQYENESLKDEKEEKEEEVCITRLISRYRDIYMN